jgi:hypothetical protein
MKKAIRSTPKKRGRPKTTGRGLSVNIRLHPPELKRIAAWMQQQNDGKLTRARALWQLAMIGLDVEERRGK